MRLIDIKRSINIAFENFAPELNSKNANFYFDNVLKTQKALRELAYCGFINLRNNKLLAQIDDSLTNSIILNSSQYTDYMALFEKLGYSIVLLHQWINNYVTTEETEETINIKLPQTDELKKFSITIELLESSLSEISIINGGGDIKIEQLDHGSLWVIISVCSTQIVKAISKAVNAALEIAKKKVELDLAKETLKRSKIATHALENFAEMQEIVIKQQLQEYSEQLEEQKEEDSNGLSKAERRNRYKKAISELTTLISAGTEFHPSLTAAQEIIDNFPSFNQQMEFKAPIADLPRNKENNGLTKQNIKEGEA